MSFEQWIQVITLFVLTVTLVGIWVYAIWTKGLLKESKRQTNLAYLRPIVIIYDAGTFGCKYKNCGNGRHYILRPSFFFHMET